MKKNIFKVLGLGYLAVCCMFIFGTNVQAYIDPSVLTYIIQAVGGIAIAVGAGIGIYWRKAKKKINDKLGIDEESNKEVESDDIEIKEE